MVTAVHRPTDFATVRVVPHSVALGHQRALTVQVQNSAMGAGIEVLPVGHPDLSSEGLWLPGSSGGAISMGCNRYTATHCSGYFHYGGHLRTKLRALWFSQRHQTSPKCPAHTLSSVPFPVTLPSDQWNVPRTLMPKMTAASAASKAKAVAQS